MPEGVPYDGFYNGNVSMMIKNGTFADYYSMILAKANRGKYSVKGTPEERVKESLDKVEAWKKEFEAIPLQERLRLRERVVDDIEPKPVEVNTVLGKRTYMRAKPSNNNNLDKRKSQEKERAKAMLPKGALTRDVNPLMPLTVKPA